MLRHMKYRFTQMIPCLVGFTYSAVGQAEEAKLFPWEQPNAPAPAAPQAAAAEAQTKKRVKGSKVGAPDARRVRMAAAPPPAPPAPRAAAPVAPRTEAPTPPPAPAANEQRLTAIEAALRDAGILAAAPKVAPPANPEQTKALETEIVKLEQQQKNLEAAIVGGVAFDSMKVALSDIKARAAKARAELDALRAEPGEPKPNPRPGLLVRLEALEAQIARLERALAGVAAAPSTPSAEKIAPKEEQAAGNAEGVVTSGYDDGFVLRSADGKFSLQPAGFVQVRYSHEFLEAADDRMAFSLPRARAGMKGTLFTKAFKYNFLADFGKGTTQLSYFYGDYTFEKDYLAVRFGLFKRPFSRALVTASERLELVSSPLTIKAFGDAHDVGVMAHNGTPAFEYAVGVFNGTGSKGGFTGKVEVDSDTGSGSVTEGDFSNVPERMHPTVVGRVAYNHGGIQGYSEADLEGGPVRFSLGGAGLADFDVDDDDRSYVRGTVDAVLKVEGFAALTAVTVSSRQDGAAFGDRAYEATGALVQAGYVIAKRFEPVARYTVLVPADDAPKTHEVAAGFNVFFHKHALKWQNEVDVKKSGPDDARKTDVTALSQFQLIF